MYKRLLENESVSRKIGMAIIRYCDSYSKINKVARDREKVRKQQINSQGNIKVKFAKIKIDDEMKNQLENISILTEFKRELTEALKMCPGINSGDIKEFVQSLNMSDEWDLTANDICELIDTFNLESTQNDPNLGHNR